MNVENFDRFLSETSAKPEWILMHPSIWNGYWSIKIRPRYISVVFRFLGRKLKNRKLYWVGLPLYWQEGMKEQPEFAGIEPEVIYKGEWESGANE